MTMATSVLYWHKRGKSQPGMPGYKGAACMSLAGRQQGILHTSATLTG